MKSSTTVVDPEVVTKGVCRAIRVGLAIQERIGVCLCVRHVLWERLGLELWLGGDTMPLMVAKEEGLGLRVGASDRINMLPVAEALPNAEWGAVPMQEGVELRVLVSEGEAVVEPVVGDRDSNSERERVGVAAEV